MASHFHDLTLREEIQRMREIVGDSHGGGKKCQKEKVYIAAMICVYYLRHGRARLRVTSVTFECADEASVCGVCMMGFVVLTSELALVRPPVPRMASFVWSACYQNQIGEPSYGDEGV